MKNDGVTSYKNVLYIGFVKTINEVPKIIVKNISHPYLRDLTLKTVLSIRGGSFSG